VPPFSRPNSPYAPCSPPPVVTAFSWTPRGRFGGPGIKKKACLARICLREADDSPSDEDETIALEPPPSLTSPPHATGGAAPLRPFDAMLEQDHKQERIAKAEGGGGEDPAAPTLNHASAAPSLGSSSIDASLTSSPAMRPCSPELSGGERELPGAQPPLVPLGTADNGSSSGGACQSDMSLLSQAAAEASG